MSSTPSELTAPHHRNHRCPWWIGWLLASPLRHWFEKPEDIVTPLVERAMRVLEVGPGMGYFTVPMAERVGAEGRVYCVDVQPQMLTGLGRRLQRKGLSERVEMRCCTATDLGVTDLAGTIDLAVLIHVLHEVEDPSRTLHDIAVALRPNGKLLFVEPKGHVKPDLFQAELSMARAQGLVPCAFPATIAPSKPLMVLLERSAG